MSNFRIPTLNAAGEFTGSALAHIQKVASAAGGDEGQVEMIGDFACAVFSGDTGHLFAFFL